MKKIQKLSFYVLAYVLCLSVYGITLVENGTSDYKIVIMADATTVEKQAAKEFQKYFEQVTKVKLLIIKDLNVDKAIFIGQFPILNIDYNSFQNDEIIIKTQGSNLFLSGDRPRGTLYAVYEFLEKYLGVHYYAEDEITIIPRTTVTIPPVNYRYAPAFSIRSILLRGLCKGYQATHYRVNGHFNRIPKELGGNNKLLGWCHTFKRLIPEKKYFKDHPEWFALKNGKRVGSGTSGQLCLTNDAMRAELTKNVLAWLKRNPDATVVSISQNDNSAYCQCENCKAIDELEGSHAGNLIRFVNKVAEDIEKEYPNIIVSTLAYTYTRSVPKISHPRKNVLIRLCFIKANCNKPINSLLNKKLYNNLLNWEKAAHQLGIWYYVANFKNFYIPHPNWHIIARDFRLFAENKVKMVYVEAEHSVVSGDGDLAHLRMYLYSKLLWNPYLKQDKLIAEFLNAYYKDAAPEIAKYMKLLEDEVVKPGARLDCYMYTTDSWLTLDTLLKAKQILENALLKVASYPKIKNRVSKQMMNVNHAILLRGEYSIFNAKKSDYPEVNIEQIYNDFADVYTTLDSNKKHGDKAIEYLKKLKSNFVRPEKSSKTPEFCKELAGNDWFEFQATSNRPECAIEDPEASNGLTCEYKQFNRWGFQYTLPAIPSIDNFIWNIKVAVKIPELKNKQDDDLVISLGFYNTTKKYTTSHVFKARKFQNGKYQWLDLGKVNLREPHYLWIMNQSNIVSYIDRIVMTRENINLTKNEDYVPEICKNLKTENWEYVIASTNIRQRFLGKDIDLVSDKNASSGTVVRMFNKNIPWAIQIRNIVPGTYDIYINLNP